MNKGWNTQTVLQTKSLEKIYMAHNVLENEGIPSVIKNEFRAYNIGYIELAVSEKDFEKALRMLREAYPEEYEEQLTCPFCNSKNISFVSEEKRKMRKVLQLLWKNLKLYYTHKWPYGSYRCNNCMQLFSFKERNKDSE